MKYVISSCMQMDYYDGVYSQANELKNAIFINDFPKTILGKFIQKMFFFSRVTIIVPQFINRTLLYYRINYYTKVLNELSGGDDKVIFIFFAEMLEYEKYNFSVMLKKRIPNAKLVYFYQDIIESNPVYLDYLKYRDRSDLIFSYDKVDAEKYGLHYHNVPISIGSNDNLDNEILYDVFFCGYAKNRYDEIIRAYEFLKGNGLSCCFYIGGVEKDKYKYENEIHYNTLTYKEYIDCLKHCRIILEIIQHNSSGNTLRVNEALQYNKCLISNNACLKYNPYYSEDSMVVFDKIDELDVDRIQRFNNARYTDLEEFTVRYFLKEISEEIENVERL